VPKAEFVWQYDRTGLIADPGTSIIRFPKSHRLRSAEEFSAVIQFRCSVGSEFLQVFAKPNYRPHSRLGLIVARKMERLAVNRNRIKRELREVFRVQQQELAGLDLVVRLRRPFRQAGSSRLAEEASKLMIQLQRCRG
jgi:ribonuclease P protein component